MYVLNYWVFALKPYFKNRSLLPLLVALPCIFTANQPMISGMLQCDLPCTKTGKTHEPEINLQSKSVYIHGQASRKPRLPTRLKRSSALCLREGLLHTQVDVLRINIIFEGNAKSRASTGWGAFATTPPPPKPQVSDRPGNRTALVFAGGVRSHRQSRVGL